MPSSNECHAFVFKNSACCSGGLCIGWVPTLVYNWTVAWSNQTVTFTAKVHVEITFFDASNTQVGNKFIPNDATFGGGGAGKLGSGSQTGSGSAPVPVGSVTKAPVKVTIPEAKRTDNINIIPDPAERTIECERQT